jgi:long-chain fatty acid transport protein
MRIRLLTLTLLAPAVANAGGVYVGEPGSQAMERAGAFVARADDPTALSINPAGLAKARGIEVYLGGNFLRYGLTFQRAGVYPEQTRDVQPSYVGQPFPEVENSATFQAVPYLSAVVKWHDLAVAAGIYAPPGVPNREFDCSVSDDLCLVNQNGAPAPQRYDVVSQTAVIAYPSLAAAYRVHPRVDVGARFSWGFGHVKARNFPWALPNLDEDVRKEGDFSADVKDNFMPAFGAGVLVRPVDGLEIGAAYSSKTAMRAKGTGDARLGPDADILTGNQVFIIPKPEGEALCEEGGMPSALKTCIDFDLPQTLAVGVRWAFADGKGGERADIELDGKWENWANASDDIVTVDGMDTALQTRLKPTYIRHGFQDVFAVRLGGHYKIDAGGKNAFLIRAGVGYDSAAAPTSWTRVDKDGRARTTLAAGVAYEIDRFRFDAGVAVVIEGEATVEDVPNGNPTFDNREQPDPPQPSLEHRNTVFHPINAGTYDSGYVVGLAGVTSRF